MLFYYLAYTAYVLVCLVVASYGRDRRIGLTGFFFVALLCTPVVVALILLVTGEKSRPSGPAA